MSHVVRNHPITKPRFWSVRIIAGKVFHEAVTHKRKVASSIIHQYFHAPWVVSQDEIHVSIAIDVHPYCLLRVANSPDCLVDLHLIGVDARNRCALFESHASRRLLGILMARIEKDLVRRPNVGDVQVIVTIPVQVPSNCAC